MSKSPRRSFLMPDGSVIFFKEDMSDLGSPYREIVLAEIANDASLRSLLESRAPRMEQIT